MKKLILWLIISCIAINFVACGQNNPNNDVENTNIVETTQEQNFTSENSINDSNIDLKAIVDEITSKEEWASLTQIEDDDLISEYFTLEANNSNYRQSLVMQCPMSAVIAEIILIEAEDTKSAMQDLQVRKDKLINTDAYYPEHKEIAENSIIGTHGNLVYFIASENAENSEKVLIDYMNSLN